MSRIAVRMENPNIAVARTERVLKVLMSGAIRIAPTPIIRQLRDHIDVDIHTLHCLVQPLENTDFGKCICRICRTKSVCSKSCNGTNELYK